MKSATLVLVRARQWLVVTIQGLAAVALLAGPARGGLVTNGSFEAVQIGAPFNSSNPADIPGWTHTGAVGDSLLWGVGYVDVVGSVTVAGDGRQFVTMGSGFNAPPLPAGWMQTINGLTPGTTYRLTFDMAAEGTDSGPQSLTASIAGVTQGFTEINGPDYWRNWVSESMTFTPAASSEVLTFSAGLVPAVGQAEDVGLDAVDIEVTPEPSAVALVGIGVVCSCVYSWRRRKPAKAHGDGQSTF